MAGEWREMTVGEIVAPVRNGLVGGPFGSNLVSRDYVPAGVPVIRGQNMGARWVAGEFAFVSDAKAETLDANIARPGDIVFTQRGTLGQVSVVPEVPYGRYVVSQSQMKLTVNRELADPLFFYYVFSSLEQRDYIRQNTIQTGVPHTNLGILRGTPVPLPPLPEQCAIAHILGTLDDKIELNRRMNETLEAMARALFKSWFVDFDPVRAKTEGRDPGLPKPLADLFPDRFEDSELGEIPAGWRVGNVGELSMLSRDGINPGEFPNEAFDHFSIPAFDEGQKPKSELGSTIKSNKFVVPPDAVLLSKLNPRIPRIWFPVVRDNHRAVCSTEFLVTLPRTGISREFLYSFLSSEAFADVFEMLVTGTSGSHQRVRPEGLLGMDAVIPTESVIHQFTKVTRPMLARVAHARVESSVLANLRDTLLPKLISGELRVQAADDFVQEATA